MADAALLSSTDLHLCACVGWGNRSVPAPDRLGARERRPIIPFWRRIGLMYLGIHSAGREPRHVRARTPAREPLRAVPLVAPAESAAPSLGLQRPLVVDVDGTLV